MQRAALSRALALAGLVLMAAGYFSPIWWVSLKAPNYPEHTFPDGVRIHLHYDSVRNGCELIESDEIDRGEGLDCVAEMNTINHYIGMEPLEKGAQLEFALAPWLFVLFGLMVVAGMFYSGPLWWALAIPAIALPLGFVLDFAAWLWWFGHNLHPWAAFTVKPFMPTVLGQGKVAQFATFSYPHYGMALICLASISLLLSTLIKRRLLLDRAAGDAPRGPAATR